MSPEAIGAFFAKHGRMEDSLLLLGTCVAAILSLVATRRLLRALLRRTFSERGASWDQVLSRRGVFEKLAWLAPAVVTYAGTFFFTHRAERLLLRVLEAYTILIFTLIFGSLLTAANDIYSTTKSSRDLPIKGYIQVLKLFLYLTMAVIVLAVLFDRSPWVFVSGVGAATAVLLLVFRDTILSFVASIQLATNDMIRIGDWIEMPKYDADGDVVDIALHTVKVQNWDLTITTIPTFKLIEDSFKNWRGMQASGARRIKRAVYIDQGSIRFLDAELVERLSRVQLLAGYLAETSDKITRWNDEKKVDPTSPLNGLHMTNIGTFRAYLQRYLRASSELRQDLHVIVRQLPPGPTGLPLEIYAFTSVTAWAEYERIQADIFDHVLAVLPEFELRVFQNPTGHDLARLRDGAVRP